MVGAPCICRYYAFLVSDNVTHGPIPGHCAGSDRRTSYGAACPEAGRRIPASTTHTRHLSGCDAIDGVARRRRGARLYRVTEYRRDEAERQDSALRYHRIPSLGDVGAEGA